MITCIYAICREKRLTVEFPEITEKSLLQSVTNHRYQIQEEYMSLESLVNQLKGYDF